MRCPGARRVERRGGGLLGRGEKHVRRVQVELGACAYELASTAGACRAFASARSGASRSSASR